MKQELGIPYRIDLAGGWLDHPFVSRHCGGPVIVASIAPKSDFSLRSGMATSTRATAAARWGGRLPEGPQEELAREIFASENPPGKRMISGSQDALGIVFPGVNRLEYRGGYWPERIDSCQDKATLEWLERRVRLVPLDPRPEGYDALAAHSVDREKARELASAAVSCWNAILQRDLDSFGAAVSRSFRAQVAMFPQMLTSRIERRLAELLPAVHGLKLTGAGGGGYALVVSETEVPGSLGVRLRRPAWTP